MTAEQLINMAWVLMCAALVMLMQAGFCFLESGLARAKNSVNVAIKNLVDFCVAAATFWVFGYALMFGASQFGWLGSSFFLLGGSENPQLLSFFLFQLVFCGTATTIISGAVAERMRFRAYLIISFIVSGLIYPIFGHWAWNGANIGEATGWLNSRGFIDFAGSTVVHSVGGWVALAAVLIVGPRMGRFGNTPKSIHGHNLPMATFGVLLLWFGWFGFNAGSTLELNDQIPLILVNTNLAAAFGGLAALILAWAIERRPVVEPVMNGVVAGLVSITACCHVVQPWAASLIGTVAGVICLLITYLLPKLKIDDVIAAFPAHAVAGAWGTLAVALLGESTRWGTGLTRWEQLQIQAQGVGVCFLWAFGVGFAVLWVINKIMPLRASEQAEIVGLNIFEHGASTELIDLLDEMRDHRDSGNWSHRVNVEPHTEVGQIASEYNLVIQRVQDEIQDREHAERKFRSIFDNAVQGIFQTTPSGEYLNANPALAHIYGYNTVDELLAAIRDISGQLYVDPTRRDEFMALLEEHDTISGFESQVYRADGEVIWIAENARVERDETGKILYYEGSVADITERRNTEALVREKQEAEAANRAKSAFLANMSHEIRTPLNGVIGTLDLLASTQLTPQQQRYADIAKASADTLLSLINDILDFSKIEAGRLELEHIPFNLHELVEDVPEMFIHRAVEKNIELTCHILEQVPRTVEGDPERLRQILINLVNNALKFTDQGEVRLRCDVAHPGDNRHSELVRFSVTDTGIGIPAERLGRLFNSFSQVDASTTRRYGGSGLGLAICKQLVEAMGGKIGVKSAVGQGTEFWFELMMKPAGIPEEEQRPQLPGELSNASVLVVDDNHTNLEILNDQLTQWGMRVHQETRPIAAIELLKDRAAAGERFQLGILDCVMPEMSGVELAEQIRQDEKLTQMPLLMLTSLDNPVDSATMQRLRLRVISKPIRQSRLFDAIASMAMGSEPFTAAAPPVQESSTDTALATEGGPKGDILIADDNETNRLVASEIVRAAGYRTMLVANGYEAVRAVKERPYDLVLMDCEMPEMDGFVATKEIRRLESMGELAHRGKQLPIVALTAQAVQGDRDRCLAAGMVDYLTKPIDRRKLIATIESCLTQSVTQSSAQPSSLESPAQPENPSEASAETSAPEVDSPPEENGILQLDQLYDRCLGKVDFAMKLLNAFVDNTDQWEDKLRTHAAEGNLVELARVAHSLKGSAGNISAERLSQAAAELEAAAKQESPTDCDPLMLSVLQELNECRTMIRNVSQLPAAPHEETGPTSDAGIDRR